MGTFKDHLQSDISVFQNADEFSGVKNVNGTDMLITIDSNILKKTNDNHNGLIENNVMMFVAADVYGELPAAGMRVSVDGDGYRVISAENENGMYEIQLRAVIT